MAERIKKAIGSENSLTSARIPDPVFDRDGRSIREWNLGCLKLAKDTSSLFMHFVARGTGITCLPPAFAELKITGILDLSDNGIPVCPPVLMETEFTTEASL